MCAHAATRVLCALAHGEQASKFAPARERPRAYASSHVECSHEFEQAIAFACGCVALRDVSLAVHALTRFVLVLEHVRQRLRTRGCHATGATDAHDACASYAVATPECGGSGRTSVCMCRALSGAAPCLFGCNLLSFLLRRR
eukprot:5431749-Pleurochrysis_carterae.AAC.1